MAAGAYFEQAVRCLITAAVRNQGRHRGGGPTKARGTDTSVFVFFFFFFYFSSICYLKPKGDRSKRSVVIGNQRPRTPM